MSSSWGSLLHRRRLPPPPTPLSAIDFPSLYTRVIFLYSPVFLFNLRATLVASPTAGMAQLSQTPSLSRPCRCCCSRTSVREPRRVPPSDTPI